MSLFEALKKKHFRLKYSFVYKLLLTSYSFVKKAMFFGYIMFTTIRLPSDNDIKLNLELLS